MTNLRIVVISILVAMGGVFGYFVFAQEDRIELSITPLSFELTANPGDPPIENTIRVFNPTNNTIAVEMEAEDFEALGEGGEIIVAPQEEITYSLKRWVRIIPEKFTLEPKEHQFVRFVIEVPENAEPGGKWCSILAGIGGIIGEQFTGTAVTIKTGALVLLTVSGDFVEDLVVREFTAPSFLEQGPVPFTIKFENRGTVHVRPKGFVTIRKPGFLFFEETKVADVIFPQQNVLPGAVRKVEAELNKKWLFGKYTANLVGSYGDANLPFNIFLTFWVFPWKIALGVFIIILLMIIFFVKTRRRWRLAFRALFKGE